MGVESSLHFPRGQPRPAATWISLVVLIVVLGLLAYVVVLGLTSPGPSPASEPLLTGPFRWQSFAPAG